jgi:hypothetical protein
MWEQIACYDTFVKWAYYKRDGNISPLRVIATLDEERGHWQVLYTSVYGPPNYVIRGNLGKNGRTLAIAHARKWMNENRYGAAPPKDLLLF